MYAKVSVVPVKGSHFLITHDADEITVVTKEALLAELQLLEKNRYFYRLITLHASVPLYAVGFLATISQAIADAQLNLSIVSTYSKDYMLIREDGFKKAVATLVDLGFTQLL